MTPPRVIFVSAVTNEFHSRTPGEWHLFHSYRDVLDQAFRRLAPEYEVVLQENLPVGVGDLLETIDHEVSRSLLLIHLAGEMAGAVPTADSVVSLHGRHPDLLAAAPSLRSSLGEESTISYTQWELYLGIHHRKPHLVFLAHAEAPRSPQFAPAPPDEASQRLHLERIRSMGAHFSSFVDQGDLARQSIRSFLHFRVDPRVDPVEPTEDAVANAWANRRSIIEQLTEAIKKPNPRDVPVTDPANVSAFVAAVRVVARRWSVNLALIVDVAARHESDVRAAAEASPSSDTLYDVAFANLALGDFTSGRFWARRAADLAIQQMHELPPESGNVRETALNALLLLFEHAKAAQDVTAAFAVIDEIAGFVDKDREPILWADIHEPFAEFLLTHARFDQAGALISDLVDIREEHQGDGFSLAATLVLWAKLLDATADYRGAEAVAHRAERMFAAETDPSLVSVATAMATRGQALLALGRVTEAEPLIREAVRMNRAFLGDDHPAVGNSLGYLATVEFELGRPREAEEHIRTALDITERSYGVDDSRVATCLNNLAELLQRTQRLREAEPLFRRALAIDERHFSSDHPRIGTHLHNLGQLLAEDRQLEEAESLLTRGLDIEEKVWGTRHPNVAASLNTLAWVLLQTKRFPEAEQLIRRALSIWQERLGPDHPNCAVALNSLGRVFMASRQFTDAASFFRQALENVLSHLRTTGHQNRELAAMVGHYTAALAALEMSQSDIHAELDRLLGMFGFKIKTDGDALGHGTQ
jgi:tetratricopeptide (TPR) repeat protein